MVECELDQAIKIAYIVHNIKTTFVLFLFEKPKIEWREKKLNKKCFKNTQTHTHIFFKAIFIYAIFVVRVSEIVEFTEANGQLILNQAALNAEVNEFGFQITDILVTLISMN